MPRAMNSSRAGTPTRWEKRLAKIQATSTTPQKSSIYTIYFLLSLRKQLRSCLGRSCCIDL